jgi:hypothetical protein
MHVIYALSATGTLDITIFAGQEGFHADWRPTTLSLGGASRFRPYHPRSRPRPANLGAVPQTPNYFDWNNEGSK